MVIVFEPSEVCSCWCCVVNNCLCRLDVVDCVVQYHTRCLLHDVGGVLFVLAAELCTDLKKIFIIYY